MTSSPYLSIVVTTRNDNHGGDMVRRTQLFIDGIVAQTARYSLPTELIIVEWNPPSDRPGIAQQFRWPAAHAWLSVRVITVPAHVHQAYRHADRLPLFQMIAKNIGIRRARGDMILVTNVDILFSEALFACIASRQLQPDRLYRTDRYDVDPNIPPESDHDARLHYCEHNVVRINDRYASRHLASGEIRRLYPKNVEQLEHITDTHTPLHFNACGDFQLASRSLWEATRGYPEFEIFSLHIDSVFNLVAHYAGAGEERLPAELRTYHIEHESGWKPELQGMRDFFKGMRRRKLKVLSYPFFLVLNRRVTRTKRPELFNTETWGLQGVELPEVACVRADWDKIPAATLGNIPQIIPKAVIPGKFTQYELMAFLYLYGVLYVQRAVIRTRQLGWWIASARWGGRWRSLGSVVIFGASETGRRALERCRKMNVRVTCFVDNDEDLHGTVFAGLDVKPVEWLQNACSEPIDAIVLASGGWKHTMARQLKKLGCPLPVIY